MGLSTQQLQLVEQRVANDGPSTAVAYLLWFFLGIVSGHRFYLGRAGTAVLQILSYFILIGFIWWIVDAFLIPGMIREKKDQIRQRVQLELLAAGGEGPGRQAPPASTAEPAIVS
ncbi:MAG: TM2 domain-containing protein [Pseudomonadota bacterium]